MIDTFMLSSAFFIVGGGIGVIAGGLFAGGKIARLRDELEYLREYAKGDGVTIRRLGRDLAEARALIFAYEATERARTASNAARKAKRLAEKALKDTNHNSMRATLEMVG